MCLQDLAISRNATMKRFTLDCSAGAGRVKANPDRIALIISGTILDTVSVYYSQPDLDALTPLIVSAQIPAVAGAITSGIAAGDILMNATPASGTVKMLTVDWPGVVSGELLVTSALNSVLSVVAVCIDNRTSTIVQELIP